MSSNMRQVLVQPTSLCNLDCDYCYVPDRQNASVMADDVLEAVARFVGDAQESVERLEVIWHAGEPLAAGLPFYRRALAAFQRAGAHGSKISHEIQTNGTLLDDAWCEWLVGENVNVGLSVDGPSFLHDARRRRLGGGESFAAVERGLSA